MARSAVVVLVPEAEAVVRALRLCHDPMAVRGVPAHVTVLHPFKALPNDHDLNELATAAPEFDPFSTTFDAVAGFPGGVVYLAPSGPERFAAMTRRVVAAFPDCPPYGGAFEEPIPHLPISTRVDQLTVLLEDDDGMWTVGPSIPLGSPTGV